MLTSEFIFRVLNDYGRKYGCKSCCGCLYYSRLCMVVFVNAECTLPRHNIHNIAPHRTTAAEAHQLLFKKVVLKTSDGIYYFRVKNG